MAQRNKYLCIIFQILLKMFQIPQQLSLSYLPRSVRCMSFVLSSLCPTHGSQKGCPCRHFDTRSSIFTASEIGDVDRVIYLLTNGRSLPNAVDSYGYSPLHFASQQGRLDVMDFLLLNGALVDGLPAEKGGCGATPLHRAAFSGQLDAAKKLMVAGANLDAKDTSFGDLRTPLHKAISQGHMSIVRLLLDFGADISLCDSSSLKPIDTCKLEMSFNMRLLFATCGCTLQPTLNSECIQTEPLGTDTVVTEDASRECTNTGIHVQRNVTAGVCPICLIPGHIVMKRHKHDGKLVCKSCSLKKILL